MTRHYDTAWIAVKAQRDVGVAMQRLADDAIKLHDAVEIEHGVPVRFEQVSHDVVVTADGSGWAFHATALIHFSYDLEAPR